LFYSASADPAVVAYDEAHKDAISVAHVGTIVADLATPAILNVSRRITAPVLVVMGQQDDLFCGLLVSCVTSGSIVANEAPYYAAATSLDAATIADTGHDLALHPSANASFTAINIWIQSH
jgi:hypothetical protein